MLDVVSCKHFWINYCKTRSWYSVLDYLDYLLAYLFDLVVVVRREKTDLNINMKNLMMIMYFVVSIMLMCCVQHGRSFFHLTPNKQHPAPPRFAVSTHKPARSYQVDTMVNQDQDSVTSSFSNLQNLKKSKGMGGANQLPELERLSESDLLNKSPTMDAMARYLFMRFCPT